MSDNDALAAPRVVIVTVIQSEYQAVRTHLTDLREEVFSGTVYEHGKFSFSSGDRVWDVLLLETGFEAGRANAVTARETVKAIRYFKPLLVIYVGLAAGIRGVEVGDVVAAINVYGYELGNESEPFLPRSEVGNISHYLVQRARAEARKTEWRRDLRMPSGSNPSALVAPIISGDSVVRSTSDQAYEFIRERYRDVRATDSGAYGVVQAASSMQVDALIVCGIADLLEAKAEYSDEQRGLAVAAPSAFVFEVLTKISPGELQQREQQAEDDSSSQLEHSQESQALQNLSVQTTEELQEREQALTEEAREPQVGKDPPLAPSSSSGRSATEQPSPELTAQGTVALGAIGTDIPADSRDPHYVPRAFGGTIPITRTDTPADSVSSSITATPPVELPTDLDDPAFFSRLNLPAMHAFEHAEAICQISGQSIIHMEHLIAGLFYSEEGGPTQLLFSQAREPIDATGLVSLMAGAGRSIPVSGSYTPTILNALPSHSPHVRAALIAAHDLADNAQVEQVDSRHLLSGALSVSDCSVIKALLGRGVDPALINWRVEPEAQSVIAGYASDSVGLDSTGLEDLLGIEDEVKVLCAVIAATNVHPPLALGLFGEWGSGKSYFMRMMEKQIRTQSASGAAGFCQNVVQLWFNAWHYSDTDLWASLASEVFEQLSLRVPLNHTVETTALRREQLLSESASTQERIDQAERQKSKAEAELRRREEQLAKLTSSRNTLDGPAIGLAFAAGIVKEVVSEPAVQAELADTERRVDHTLDQAAQALNYSSVEALKADVLAQKKTLRGLGQVWTPLRLAWKSFNTLTLLWLTCGCVVAVILAFLLWMFRQNIAAVVVGVATVVLALATALAPAIGVAQKLVRVAGRAQAQVDSILKKEQADLDSLVSGAKKNRDDAEKLVGEAKIDLTEAKKKSQDIQRSLDELRADHQLLAFIQARHASTDYIRRRGSIGKARDDFEKLAFFLEQVKREPPQADDKTGQGEPTARAGAGRWRIDRIILYIDDLDRCSEEKVMDVLQAIHLLLAFELFVVVVGVDPRWLLYTVKQRSPAFQEGVKEHRVTVDVDEHDHALRATPLNYLEKIFQIPFTLRPMTKEGFNRLVEKLIQGDAEPPPIIDQSTDAEPPPIIDQSIDIEKPASSDAADVGAGTDGRAIDHEALSVSPAIISPTMSEPASKSQVEVLRAKNLEIDEWEQECIKKCFCLIPSPRTTKRFVNIYRLLRAWAAMGPDRNLQSDEQHHQQRAALLLLAILIGYPAEATEILSSLIDEQTTEKLWWDFVTSFSKHKAGATNGVTEAKEFAASDEGNSHQQNPQSIDSQGSGSLPSSSSMAMDAARWCELLNKLEMVRSLMPESESDDCTAFVHWAPQVARYSFRSGLTLLAHRPASKMPAQPEAAGKTL